MIEDILEERGKRYGSFEGHADLTQTLKLAMYAHPNYKDLPFFMRESLEMLQHKVGRILNGDPFYIDSWVDCVGYSQLVVDILKKEADEE